MVKILLTAFLASFFTTCFSYADCPHELTFDDARRIANDEVHGMTPIGNQKVNLPVKGTSKVYTTPEFVEQVDYPEDPNQLVCRYKYFGKVTGRDFWFQFRMPK